MTLDALTLAAPVATVLAACVGAFVSGRYGARLGMQAQADARRREVATASVDALRSVRDLLLRAETDRDTSRWAATLSAAFDSLDDGRTVMPSGLRHIRSNVQWAVGEAAGFVSMASIDGRAHGEPLEPFDGIWNDHAIEYVDHVTRTLQVWRDCNRREASRVAALTFDEWLPNRRGA